MATLSREFRSGAAGRTPPARGRVPRAGEVIEEFAGDCDDWAEVYRSGAIEFEIPASFPVGDPGFAARDYMLYPFTSPARRETWLPDETLRSRIRWSLWDVSKLRGSYPGWNTGRGFVTEFALTAIQLAFVTREMLPTSWPNPESTWHGVVSQSPCDDAGKRIHALLAGDYLVNNYGESRLFSARQNDPLGRCPTLGGYQLTVTIDSAKARREEKRIGRSECRRRYSFTIDTEHGSPKSVGLAGFGETPFVLLCASTWQGYAEVADEFLYWGNVAYTAATRGWATDLWGALEYLSMATRCGRMASGALMVPARTVVHELLHTFPGHCETSCCQAGLAGWWWARCRAWLAAAEVLAIRQSALGFLPYHVQSDQDSVVDTHFVYPWGAYVSGCARTDPAAAAGKYAMVVAFTDPAKKGDAAVFTVLDEQIPTECQ